MTKSVCVLSYKLRDFALFKRLKACLDANVFSMYIGYSVHLGPVVRKVNNAVDWINLYPVDRVIGFPNAPVVEKVDKAIHWVNHFPVNNAINLRITYPLDSD